MAHYGKILYQEEPIDLLYKYFDDYFNHPQLTKIKDVEECSMYMCKLYCMLSNECRYLVVFTPKNEYLLNSVEYLKNMRWVSFQTRTLPNKYDIPFHSYVQSNDNPELNKKIEKVKSNSKSSTYKCETYPITCTLLNITVGLDQYQNTGTIISALETYNTIFCLI